MNETLRNLLTGKVLCGDANGGRILITNIDFVEREIENEKLNVLELSGEAGGYLVNSNNPDAGARALPEPVSVVIQQNTEKDPVIQLRSLSRALGLSDEDTIDGTSPDWLDRFDEENPKSVIPLLRERGIYIKTTLKQNWEKAVKYGESPFYFNPFFVPTRKSVNKSRIEEIKAKLKAKLGETVDIA